jgi:hypothetical protein
MNEAISVLQQPEKLLLPYLPRKIRVYPCSSVVRRITECSPRKEKRPEVWTL